MSNLASRSALEGLALPGHYGLVGAFGVVASERKGLALATVLVRKGQDEALRRRIHELFSIELSTTPRRIAAGSTAFIWAGPGHWLAVAEMEEGHRFEAQLQQGLAGLASVTDQSDGRVVIRISGDKARIALAKGLPIDLHPRAFGPGQAASTVAGHIGVQIWQLDDAPTYELAMSRGFAGSFWQSMLHMTVEFGVDINLA